MIPSLTADLTGDALRIGRGGRTLLIQNARPGQRPYIHPLIAPDGDGTLSEDAPPHHAWQHGLYTGLNDVNGFGFWTEGKYPPHTADGTFHPAPLTPAAVHGDTIRWSLSCRWEDPQGKPLLTERQHWRLRAGAEETIHRLDLLWSITAAIDLHLGRYDYGGLFLRMPCLSTTPVMLLNSEGATARADADAHRARWVALAMPLADRAAPSPAGCALMDHPANDEYPAPWRVDGDYGIGPARCAAGAWDLPAGATANFRHRVVLFTGPPEARLLDTLHQEFAADPEPIPCAP
jgi:hypothetical protein